MAAVDLRVPVDEMLVALVREQASASASTAAELRTLGERMVALERAVGEQTPLLARLVAIHEDRDRREAAAEQRAQLELQERSARAQWIRTQLDRIATPAAGAVALVLSTVGAGVAAWFAGLFPGSKP